MSDKLLIDRELVDNLYLQTGEGQLRNLPTAQFLDLEGVERIELNDFGKLAADPRGRFVRLSDLTDKLLPPVVGPSDIDVIVEMRNQVWRWRKIINDHSDEPDSVAQMSVMIEKADAILDRIKGVK